MENNTLHGKNHNQIIAKNGLDKDAVNAVLKQIGKVNYSRIHNKEYQLDDADLVKFLTLNHSPANMRERKKDKVENMLGFMTIDHDGDRRSFDDESVKLRLAGISYLAYPSPSHIEKAKEGDYRMRRVIPTKGLTKELYPKQFLQMYKDLELDGNGLDKTSNEIERFFYPPDMNTHKITEPKIESGGQWIVKNPKPRNVSYEYAMDHVEVYEGKPYEAKHIFSDEVEEKANPWNGGRSDKESVYFRDDKEFFHLGMPIGTYGELRKKAHIRCDCPFEGAEVHSDGKNGEDQAFIKDGRVTCSSDTHGHLIGRAHDEMEVDPITLFDNLDKSETRFKSAYDIVQNHRQAKWLIKGIIPENGLIEVFGASGSYKSFIQLDMLFCIAAGISYHGHQVKQCAVAYIAGEGLHGLNARLKALAIHYDIDLEGLPFYSLPAPVDLSDERQMKILSKELEELEEVGIVIFDTLHRNSGATDENSAKDFAMIQKNIDTHLIEVSGVVGWVHHTGVGNESKDRGRGTSARYASCDTVIQVERLSEFQTARISCKKQKDAGEFSPLAFKLINIPIGLYDDEVEITSLVPILTEVKQSAKTKIKKDHKELLQCLKEVIIEKGGELPKDFKDHFGYIDGLCIPIATWKPEAFKIITSSGDNDPKKIQEAKKKAFQRLRKDLKDEELIIEFNDHVAIKKDCMSNVPDL